MERKSSVSWMAAGIIFALALAVRLAYVSAFPIGSLEGDSIGYDAIGWNLAQGKGFANAAGEPTAFSAPVYPLFLAGIYRLVGHQPLMAGWMQAFLGAAICMLAFLTAHRLYEEGTAKLAGVLCALYPPLIIFTSAVMSETLFMFWLGWAVYGLVSREEAGWRFCSGIGLGLALLTRPILVFFLPLLVGWLVFVHRRRVLAPTAALLGGVLLVVLPWTVRNYERFDAFIPLTTHGGLALFNCYVLPPNGFSFNSAALAGEGYLQLADEVSRNRYLYGKTLTFALQHPLEVAKLTAVKALFFFYPFDGYWYAMSLGSKYNIFWGVILVFSLIGVITSRRRAGPAMQLVFLLMLSFVAAMLVFQAIPRFRLPMEPFLICIAAAGARYTWRRWPLAAVALGGVNAAMFLTFRYIEFDGFFQFLKRAI